MLNGLSWLYGKIIDSRNSLYTRGVLSAEALPAPTVSVGNITVGGTGKTPLVAYISEFLADRGEKVCVITRGYRRKDEKSRVIVSDSDQVLSDPLNAGDEAFELAKQLLGRAVVIADRDRVSAADWAFEEFGISAFVLDDAFQHRRARRDLDIVTIDATNPFGNLRTIPKGILRESVANIARADAAVLTRTNLCNDLEALRLQIHELAPELAIFESRNVTRGFRSLSEFVSGGPMLSERPADKAFAFCGLGNPGNFFGQLVQSDVNLVDSRAFRDHHAYTARDILAIEDEARTKGASVLVTTAKDAVKLSTKNHTLPCFVYESDLEFEDKKGFTDLLGKAFDKSKQN